MAQGPDLQPATGDSRLAFLLSEGIDAVRHNSHEDLLPHLMGTSALLAGWGARQAVVDAGLFHSVYGTEYFRTESVDASRRDAVRTTSNDSTRPFSCSPGRAQSPSNSLSNRSSSS